MGCHNYLLLTKILLCWLGWNWQFQKIVARKILKKYILQKSEKYCSFTFFSDYLTNQNAVMNGMISLETEDKQAVSDYI